MKPVFTFLFWPGYAARLWLLMLAVVSGPRLLAQPAGCTGTDAGGNPAGSGLYAEYYTGYFADDHTYFTDNTRAAGLRAAETQVNFASSGDWRNLTGVAGSGTPTDAEDYSLRLRGSINIPTAGSYTFYLTSDDASWLWLDGAARALPATSAAATINNSGRHPLQVRTATVSLSAGLHSLLIHYGEAIGDNILVLEYENTAAGIARQVVPASAFCTAQQGSSAPLGLVFSPAVFTASTGTAVSTGAPTVTGSNSAVTGFAVAGILPPGITLNTTTGVFTASAAVPPGTYTLDLSVSNAAGTSTFSNVVTFQINGFPPAGCVGNDPGGNPANSGLYAQYYPGYFNDDPSYFLSTTAGLTRIDAQVNFDDFDSFGNLGTTAAGTVADPSDFSLQMKGSLRIATGGVYTFYLTADDAAYLWLDNAALASPALTAAATIDNGGAHGVRTLQANVYLVPGLHNILLEYGELAGENVLVLEYENTAAGIARQVVPASAFCTAQQPLRNLPTSLQYSPASITVLVGTSTSSAVPTISSATTAQFILANASSLPAGITINAATGQLTVAAAVPAGTYRADVAVINADGAVTFSAAVAFFVAPAPFSSCTSLRPDGGVATGGLFAEYYWGYFADDPAYFTTNTPIFTRVEGSLNYTTSNDWGNLLAVASGPTTDPDDYSARYRGSLLITTAGSYTFYLTSDDGSRLWLDAGALMATPANSMAVVDNGGTHPITTSSGTVTLQAGRHDILVQYGESIGDNVLQLEYEGPDSPTRQIVPVQALCSAGSGRPLPVTLISFEAQTGGNGVVVRWATAQERNSAYYIVERSANGQVFEQVVKVAAAGNTDQRQRYTITDTAPLPGLSYYRLRQVDRDGKEAYSQVVPVTTEATSKATIQLTAAPNPSNGAFAVRIAQRQPGAGQLQLLDMRGRPCYTAQLSGEEQEVAVKAAGLPAGLYLLRLTTADGSVTQRVVIE